MQLPQHTGNRPAGQPGVATAGLPLLSRGTDERPPIRSLYIHTPFCAHKCHYCDFYSFVDTRDQQSAFVDRLVSELQALAPMAAGQPLRTVFIGGGTPSLLRIDLWERLLSEIGGLFNLSMIRSGSPVDVHGLAEFTVECNPESASPELMALLRSGGVNRVSIGAQSFHLRHLKTLERWHDPDNVACAVEAARTAGIPRQSIDLIFGIPGQTLEDWNDDLRRALALKTEHLSCYSLTYEPNTAMTRRLAMGDFEPVAEDLEVEMFRHTVRTLRSAGLDRYEVSNFARPGRGSRHNIAYWLQEQWLAAGPSASGHAWAGAGERCGSHRWKNVPRLGDYLAGGHGEGFSPIVDHEPPDPRRLVRERVMTGLRMAAGLDPRSVFAGLPAQDLDALVAAARSASDSGWLSVSGEAWRLTDEGYLLADRVCADLMACVA
ncbi:MAG: radical SAM family heme chaperone HemW [Phycisphaerales bacterium]